MPDRMQDRDKGGAAFDMRDIHSHILFGVDDGSRSLAESQAMLRAAREVGFKEIACTPHFAGSRGAGGAGGSHGAEGAQAQGAHSGRRGRGGREGRFDRELIERNFGELAGFAAQLGVKMRLGFEVHWKALIEAGIEHAPGLRIDGTDLLLLEFSYGSLPPNWQRIVFDLQAMGLQVVIAHPERYAPLQKDSTIAQEMKHMGCLLQLSADFAGRGLFSKSRKTAISLMKHGLVDYIASDAHCAEDYQNYPKAMALWQKKRLR
jgi:protein-tyrosine phosphatase